MKTALTLLIAVHGLIHIAGGIKAFKPAALKRLQPVTPSNGILWIAGSALLLVAAVLFFSDRPLWWVWSAAGILLSQFVITRNWSDAKYGTIANIALIPAVVIGCATWKFHTTYQSDAQTYLAETNKQPLAVLTERDIEHLPAPVKKYIRYTGAIGKPQVRSFLVEFDGRIREKGSEWMNFTSQQYNFQESSVRLFFMKATMKHLPVAGYHCFRNGTAFMDIRLLSMFTVQHQSGNEMNIAETVTFFNDMCVMAPATLTDPRIHWMVSDNLRADAVFTNNGISVLASLYFNEQGELINFVSADRYATINDTTMQRLQWSTPLKNYRTFNGVKLASEAQTIYAYPDGEFCYGEFRLTGIEYNPRSFGK